jgi:hypothetical protein
MRVSLVNDNLFAGYMNLYDKSGVKREHGDSGKYGAINTGIFKDFCTDCENKVCRISSKSNHNAIGGWRIIARKK